MALFNLPTGCPGHGDAALRAVIEIRRATSLTFDGQRLRTRIGVNTGPVVAGVVGDSRALCYTALGDAVNVAARIEELNKKHGTDVLISGATGDHLQGAYPVAELGYFTLRGRAEPLRVLRLLD